MSRQANTSARPRAHTAVASTSMQRQARRALNEAIDRALLGYALERQRVLELGRREDPALLADRVRMRAMRLMKSRAAYRRQILDGAETLVVAVYRRSVPRGWMCGFCDASVAAHDDGRAVGLGSVILDANGRTVARISRRSADCQPFEAEIAALEAALDAVVNLGDEGRRIRLYTDCDALVALWLQNRGDPRLRGVRALTRRLRGFQLHRLPRRHSQAAHRLARDGALR